MKKTFYIAAILVICLTGALIVPMAGNNRAAADLLTEEQKQEAVALCFQNGEMTALSAGSSEEITQEELEKLEITFDGQDLEIRKAGTYILSGALEGSVLISSAKKKEVTLVLDGFCAVNESGEALSVSKTGNLVLILNDGTENVLTSGIAVAESMADTAAEDKAEEDAKGGAFHSKAETLIRGGGSLKVNGYLNNGIHVTKSLVVESGDITVYAKNNAVKVKDAFCMNGGKLTITSEDDGIKAEREEEIAAAAVTDPETGEILQEAEIAVPAAGEVILNGGEIQITAAGSGIQTLQGITLNAGTLTVRSSKDGLKAGTVLTVNDGTVYVDSDQDALFAAENLFVCGGTLDLKTEGDYKHKAGEGESFGGPPGGNRNSTSSQPSRKALKSDGGISITGGDIRIDSADDAVHCAEILEIAGGTISISTGDDGLHSDTQIDLSDGTVTILTSYEAVEANQINISGGDLKVASNDDGFNANGGDSFGGPSRGQAASDTSKETPNLNISGGTIYVNAVGDGLDSNANITISGGYTVVDGPTSSANGPLDGGTENGGVISISGGTVFAGGASGMAEGFSANSSQCSFLITFPISYAEGTLITVSLPDGTELFRHTAASGGNSLVFSCPELVMGESCILTVAEYEFELPLTKMSNYLRVSSDGEVTQGSSAGGGFPGGGFPGGPGR